QPGKPAEKKPLVLWKGANVGDAAKDLHKDFYDFFKFARVWGKSKYPGQVVGLNYKLSDEDTVEIHIKTKSSF
ncbi:MAG: TGS domain-containing protein, partial [Nanoarchaeota archaeon]|nr:TGS domain-containing protein [Nanoarchaeota archaeon]